MCLPIIIDTEIRNIFFIHIIKQLFHLIVCIIEITFAAYLNISKIFENMDI